jgi:hypothetical protein
MFWPWHRSKCQGTSETSDLMFHMFAGLLKGSLLNIFWKLPPRIFGKVRIFFHSGTLIHCHNSLNSPEKWMKIPRVVRWSSGHLRVGLWNSGGRVSAVPGICTLGAESASREGHVVFVCKVTHCIISYDILYIYISLYYIYIHIYIYVIYYDYYIYYTYYDYIYIYIYYDYIYIYMMYCIVCICICICNTYTHTFNDFGGAGFR